MKKIPYLTVAFLMLGGIFSIPASASGSYIEGDVNCDGIFSVADILSFQKWLLGADLSETDVRNADINTDKKLDVFDLVMMRKKLISQSESAKYSGLFINEICASNKNSLHDINGDSPDWIEIYNGGTTNIDLSGMGLSDGKKNRFKFRFPEQTVINSGEYIVIFCDGTLLTEKEFHAPFSLSASGETVYLTSPDGQDIDTVTFPALDTDVTFGRYDNGSNLFSTLGPTPNSSNNNGEKIVAVSAPIFSVNGGFYENEFKLNISSENRILYTTDGSDPRNSATARTFSDDLRIYDNTNDPNHLSNYNYKMTWIDYLQKSPENPVDKCIVVRAAAVDSNGNFSKVVSNSYFVGRRAEYFTELKVMSITTNEDYLFDDEKGIFAHPNYFYEGADWERPCNIQVFDGGKSVFSQDVGMKVSGNASVSYPQKSITLYARNQYSQSKMKYDFFDCEARNMDGKIIDEYKKVTLRDGGDEFGGLRFRDDLNAWLSKGLDLSVQAKNDYIVFINGEFWGYYSMQEKLDENYIESHFGVSADNVTTNKTGKFDGDTAVADEYNKFFKWACTADMSNDENYRKFCDNMDVQSFIDFMAVETYICNWDSVVNVNNYMLWRANVPENGNIFADGKWRFMLYDTEYSTGFAETGYDYPCLLEVDDSGKDGSFGTVLRNLLKSPDFKSRFQASYYEIMENNFDPQKVSERISYYLDRNSQAYIDTGKRFGYTAHFIDAAEELREFFEKRPEYASAHLEEMISKYE